MSDPARVLSAARTIAVVGLSRSPAKDSYGVASSLQAHGFRIIPVNPHAGELLGERVHRRLAEITEPVDLVDVFRPAADAPAIAREAVAIGAKGLWLQEGIVSAEARRIAEAAGLDYVEDRCTAVVRAVAGITHR